MYPRARPKNAAKFRPFCDSRRIGFDRFVVPARLGKSTAVLHRGKRRIIVPTVHDHNPRIDFRQAELYLTVWIESASAANAALANAIFRSSIQHAANGTISIKTPNSGR